MPTPPPPSRLTLCQLAERDERVFASHPQVGRYFPAAGIEEARQRLGRAIERGDGPGLVVGAPGTGKSLLLQVLASQYHNRFDVVLLACARICTRRALLQAILFELGLPYQLRDEGALRLGLLDHLLSADHSPAGLLLLVDEAQALSPALLDELRVMTNLIRGGAPRVRLVLAGSAALEEAFAHPDLECFSQRLAARCYLAPFGREETKQFVRAQITACGGAPNELLAEDTWEAIFEATDGVPRLVNQLCDRALFFAAAEGHSRIDRQALQAAWSDLQQLPSPWDTPAAAAVATTATATIEFGGLNDVAPPSDESPCDELLDADSTDETELTELDEEEHVVELSDLVAPQPARNEKPETRCDPFAEQFDEEEVVLDNFAAWDDLFASEAPRVENRRDPGFSPAVQAAMDASHVPETSSPSATAAQLREFDPDGECEPPAVPDSDSISAPSAPAEDAESADWPPLRLAVLSEPAPLKPIPLVAPAECVESGGAADWNARVSAMDLKPCAGKSIEAEPPVLIIEDEPVPSRGNPPVRREAYRHLFSRLRSG